MRKGDSLCDREINVFNSTFLFSFTPRKEKEINRVEVILGKAICIALI